jgi:hypothetical protein
MTSDPVRLAARPPAWTTPRVLTWSLAIGVAGAVAFAIGVAVDPAQAYFSYLTAYIFAAGIVLGSLSLLMIEHLIGASWFVALRRAAESIAATLPLLLLLFIPVAIGAGWLYPWTDPAALDAHARTVVQGKRAYLNMPFFLVRAGIYFSCWIVMAELLRRWSLRQDDDRDARWTSKQYSLSAPGVIVFAFTLTFAAFDWIMSLAPTWFSTIFGVQIFAGGMVGSLALLAVMAANPDPDDPLAATVTPEHLSAVGKMVFTFVIFWAYATFVQLLIIWIADVPEEVSWYVPRLAGSWLWLGLFVAVGHFAIPFFLLLSYELKRRARVLVRLGGWLLAMHYLEMYWIVMPQRRPATALPHWLDLGALAMVAGLTVACAAWRSRGHAALPIGDPALAASLEYSET